MNRLTDERLREKEKIIACLERENALLRGELRAVREDVERLKADKHRDGIRMRNMLDALGDEKEEKERLRQDREWACRTGRTNDA